MKDFFKHIHFKLWSSIVVGAAVGGVAWGALNNNVTKNSSAIGKLESRVEKRINRMDRRLGREIRGNRKLLLQLLRRK